MRANMPFSIILQEMNMEPFFIGYARKFSVTRQMLEHMFQGDAEGNLDSLLILVQQAGTFVFVPTVDFLDDLGDD